MTEKLHELQPAMSNPPLNYKIEKLLPLLRQVVELVKKNGVPSPRDICPLLSNQELNLGWSWSVKELIRWGKVLSIVRNESNEGKKEEAQRALMLRGIPEAHAKLAVEAVAHPAISTARPRPSQIQISFNTISFGELQPGEAKRVSLMVSGGPGKIKVESDMVAVKPTLFGPGETVLNITVKGGFPGQVLMDKLILQSESEIVLVDLTAQWRIANVVATDALVVPDDGTLEELLNQAKPGDTIQLRSGEFYLPRQMLINKAVRLYGEGKDKTQIICDGEGYVLKIYVEEPGLFAAYDIAFRHQGTRWASVLRVEKGNVDFWHCQFAGGIQHESDRYGGNGLYLTGRVRGIVEKCEFVANGADGIRLGGQAQLLLVGNQCCENKEAGITYLGQASGTARNNECLRNKGDGIYVGQEARPLLEDNRCCENKGAGIVYRDQAAGTARNNNCKSNDKGAIYVAATANPQLMGNYGSGSGDRGEQEWNWIVVAGRVFGKILSLCRKHLEGKEKFVIVLFLLVALAIIIPNIILPNKKNNTTIHNGVVTPSSPEEFIERARQGNTNEIKRLLAGGMDPNVKDGEGKSALRWAAKKGHPETVKVLLEGGADVDAVDNDGRTALIGAAFNDYTGIVRLLLDWNANVDVKDNEGKTALLHAAEKGYTATVNALLNKSADVDAVDKSGWTALRLAANKSHTDVVQALLNAGAKVNVGNGYTAMGEAALSGHMDIVSLLLDNSDDDSKADGVLFAADQGHIAIMYFLLKNGANPERRMTTKDERTALLHAAANGYTGAVQILLAYEIDVNKKDKEGKTALMLAKENGHADIVEILKVFEARE